MLERDRHTGRASEVPRGRIRLDGLRLWRSDLEGALSVETSPLFHGALFPEKKGGATGDLITAEYPELCGDAN